MNLQQSKIWLEKWKEVFKMDVSKDNKDQVKKDSAVISLAWNELVSNPESLIDLYKQNVVFAAGGGLVTTFGNAESRIWISIESASNGGSISIAGIEFQIEDLAQIGEYYRFLESRGFSLHCIDERLEGEESQLDKEVHEKCGACMVVGQAANLNNVENILLSELGQRIKQEVDVDMPNHESMVILVDLSGSDEVIGEKRKELKEIGGLPLNTSLSLDSIQEWVNKNQGKSAEKLIETLVKWNVQIARNIIGEEQNILQKFAEKTVIVVDSREVENHLLFNQTMNEIRNVSHGELMLIQ